MLSLPEETLQTVVDRIAPTTPNGHFPVEGNLELTYRCVLRCKHCFTACNHHPEQEMTAPEWCRLLDEACDLGTLELLITGGDPMLKGDLFKQVYTHAKKKGFLVTIFTSGTLIDEKWAQFFDNDPPFKIEVSLYGATEATYEEVTQVKGSYQRCIKGFEWMDKYKVPFKVKTFVLDINKKEFHACEKIARSVGQKDFRFDAAMHPRIDRSTMPKELALTPKEIVELDYQDAGRRKSYEKIYQRPMHRRTPDEMQNFNCGAGKYSFWSNPYGKLQVCTIVPGEEHQYDWRKKGDLRKCFYEFFPTIIQSKPKRRHRCADCYLWEGCDRCPAWSSLVHGDLETPVDYVCEITHRRAMTFGTDPKLYQNSMMYKRIMEGKTFPETIVSDEGFHGLQLPSLATGKSEKSGCGSGGCCSK